MGRGRGITVSGFRFPGYGLLKAFVVAVGDDEHRIDLVNV